MVYFRHKGTVFTGIYIKIVPMACHGFELEDEVEVVGGSHQGLRGRVIGATDCFVKVSKSAGEHVRVKPKFLVTTSRKESEKPTSASHSSAGSENSGAAQVFDRPRLECGMRVRVVKGTYVRLTGEIVGVTAKQYAIRVDESCRDAPSTFRVAHSSVVEYDTAQEDDGSSDDASVASSVGSLNNSIGRLAIAERPLLEKVAPDSEDWLRIQRLCGSKIRLVEGKCRSTERFLLFAALSLSLR